MKYGRNKIEKGKIEYKRPEPKVIKVNLSLLVGIIFAILILFSSFAGHKMSIIGTKVLTNLVEEITEEDDTWEIINMSESEEDTGEDESANSENNNNDSTENQNTQNTSEEIEEDVDEEDMTEKNTTEESSNEEQIASVSESSDDEASAVSNEDVTYSSDEGVSAVASTLTTEYSSIYNVGASSIVIDDISWNEPDTITTNGALTYMTYSNAIYIYWSETSIGAGNTITGTYTLTYYNIGYDADGDLIDLTIYGDAQAENCTSSMFSWDADEILLPVARLGTYMSLSSNTIDSKTMSVDNTLSGNEGKRLAVNIGATADMTVSFTKSETGKSATGSFVFYICDIDVVKTGTPEYNESITLGDEFSSTVYLEEDTTVAVDGRRYYATLADDATEISSLTTLVGASFTFTWKGMGCATAVLLYFGASTITSNIYTSYDGGSTYNLNYVGGKITANNTNGYSVLSQTDSVTSSVTAYWKNSYEYSTASNAGYHLVKIVYDDTEVTTESSYTFEEVSSDHTFDVYYVANSYSVYFDGNGATSGSTDDMEGLYYDITYTLNENGFVRLGYTFTGWNTEADGSGTSYTNEEEFSNLTYEDGGTVTLYAQWEENKVTINITKVSSETSTDEDGNTVYTYLEGVEFSLYMLICEDETHDHDTDLIDTGSYDTTCWELIGTYTSGSDGTITLSDLPITRIYRLVETKTVEDYLLPSGQWKIEFDYGNLTDDEAVIDYNGQGVKITAIGNPPALSLQTVSTDDTETDILYLYNSSSYDVPTTGSFETNNFYLVGIPIILMGIIILLIWKRRTYTLNKFSSLRNSVNNARKIIDNWDKNS